jgi:hypothetical protein
MKGTFRTYTREDGELRYLCRISLRRGRQIGATGATKIEAQQRAILKACKALKPIRQAPQTATDDQP